MHIVLCGSSLPEDSASLHIRESGLRGHRSNQKPLSCSWQPTFHLIPSQQAECAVQNFSRRACQAFPQGDDLLHVHLPGGLLTSTGIAIMQLGRRKWNVAILGKKETLVRAMADSLARRNAGRVLVVRPEMGSSDGPSQEFRAMRQITFYVLVLVRAG